LESSGYVGSIHVMSQANPASAILETCLSVADLARSIDFYARVFGYPIMAKDERFCAMNIDGRQVLLLFGPGTEASDLELPFGRIPRHGASGSSHIGFSIPTESLEDWRKHLDQLGISIESSFTWPLGGVSIYFRDPDGHLLELLSPGVWPTY
jgi:catechol 2,3-dioxygenase-like lactoylglutathione lyase family enzyme